MGEGHCGICGGTAGYGGGHDGTGEEHYGICGGIAGCEGGHDGDRRGGFWGIAGWERGIVGYVEALQGMWGGP